MLFFIVACVRAPKFTISFDSNGGSIIAPIVYDGKLNNIIPDDPNKEGYIFDGWYWDNHTFNEIFSIHSLVEKGIKKDIIIYAKWNINQYTITFESNGGSEVQSVTQDYQTSITLASNPTKLGYSFVGWFMDSSLITPFTLTSMPAEDITLYAKWNINSYTIFFDSNGGSIIQNMTLNYNAEITPSIPTRPGYTFVGWFMDSSLITPLILTRMPAQNITVYAKWDLIDYEIEYILGGGLNHINNPSSYTIHHETIILDDPIKEGYTFDGWYQNQNFEGSPMTEIVLGTTGKISLFAKWTINQYSIVFDSNGGSDVLDMTLNYHDPITLSIPTKLGYTFVGWFMDPSLINIHAFDTMPAFDMTLYAKWDITLYDIIYELDAGINDTVNPSSYTMLTETINLNDPTKEGYTFLGWYDNPNFDGYKVYEIDLGSTESITLYAKWTINQYAMTYQIKAEGFHPESHISLTEDETIILISMGGIHSSALSSNGRLFMWGDNYFGQLGDQTTTRRLSPIDITHQFPLVSGEKIISVSLGGNHSSALTSSGRVFMWGSNEYGQIGDNTTINKFIPTDITSRFQLVSGEKIIQVSLGFHFSSALSSSGRLFMWGFNLSGQLGDQTNTNKQIPTDITSKFQFISGEKIVKMITGTHHSAALSSNGRIFTWGYNEYAQIGDNTLTNRHIPTEITTHFQLALGEKIDQVSFGTYHSYAKTSNGRVFMWGLNNYQLGERLHFFRLTPSDITSHLQLEVDETIDLVSARYETFSIITSNNRLLLWGRNNSGQIGNLTTTEQLFPTEITEHFSLLQDEKILFTSFGYGHSAAITSFGRVFTWGGNETGQLGDQTTINKLTPIPLIRYLFEIVSYEIYDFNTPTPTYLPTLEGYAFDGWYTDILLKNKYTLNLMPAEDLILYAKWNLISYDLHYELDGGTLQVLNPANYTLKTETIILNHPTKEGYTFSGWYDNPNFDGYSVIEIVTGTTEDITLYAKWTINPYTITYQMKTDDFDPESHLSLIEDETISLISTGGVHSSALTSNGRLLMWGYNFLGQLGDQTTTRRLSPTDITYRFPLIDGDKIISVSLGGYHSSALTSSGRLFMWGSNEHGQIGDNTTINRLIPTDITSRFPLIIGEKIIQVSLGDHFSSALTSNGRLFMWGSNHAGQLGDQTNTGKLVPTEITSKFPLIAGEKITSIAMRHMQSSAITSSGRIFTWGYNEYAQLGDNTVINRNIPTDITSYFQLTLGEKISQISFASYHSYAKTSTGRVFMWGLNNYQLGERLHFFRFIPTDITNYLDLEADETIDLVSAGYNNFSMITSNGRLLIWGRNNSGQIGNLTTTEQLFPTEITHFLSLIKGEEIVNVSFGFEFTSAQTSNGRMFTWGRNDTGQLGDQSTTNKLTPVPLVEYIFETIHVKTYDYQEEITFYLPVLEGYTFDGWYTSRALKNKDTQLLMPAQHIKCYGYWIKD
jgi:uncharacterized repeat protein (TIGR02543 family)